MGLACGMGQAAPALPTDEPPVWTEDAPVLSRLLEEGYAAQRDGRWAQAATSYCAAARHGSVDAQYRLGRLLLAQRPVHPPQQAQARALLALAAQQGHAVAMGLLDGGDTGADLPNCMVNGGALEGLLADVNQDVVPADVVERYVLALPPDKRRNALLIQRLAPRFNVDARLALAIARAESNLDAQAVSPRQAMGLMQLIPDTAARFGVRNVFDPEQNVRGGLAYLRWLLERFGGNVALTSAAYNAGEQVVERHGGVPPYAETQQYVQRILRFYRSPMHVWPATVVELPLPTQRVQRTSQ